MDAYCLEGEQSLSTTCLTRQDVVQCLTGFVLLTQIEDVDIAQPCSCGLVHAQVLHTNGQLAIGHHCQDAVFELAFGISLRVAFDTFYLAF